MTTQARAALPRPPADAAKINTFVIIGMLPTRNEIGFSLLPWWQLFMVPATIVAVPELFNLFVGEALPFWVLATFAGAAFLRAFYTRQRHWHGIVEGVSPVHGHDTGSSLLAAQLGLQGACQCIIDPLVVLLAGGLIGYAASFPVGLFVVICGVCFAFSEFHVWQATKRALLHTHDGIRDADRHGRIAGHVVGTRGGHIAAHVAEQRPSNRSAIHAESAGTPTGAADDLEVHFARQQDQ